MNPILIVDDEEDMGWAMQAVLRVEGVASVVARSAADALAALADRPVRAAFVDLKLPDRDGLDLIRAARRLRPGLPCLLLSGYLYPDDEAVRSAVAAGDIIGFLSKPFLLDHLKAAVRLVGEKYDGSGGPGRESAPV